MKYLTRLWIAFLSCSPILLSWSCIAVCVACFPVEQRPESTINLRGYVYHIVDGDTVDIETTIRYRVRLRDCWAPESRTRDLAEKKLGLASKENMKKIALGKQVIVSIPFDPSKLQRSTGRLDDAQSLSRWLGEVWHGDKNLSAQQVQGGFATKTKQPKELAL